MLSQEKILFHSKDSCLKGVLIKDSKTMRLPKVLLLLLHLAKNTDWISVSKLR